ncbi:MAG TPA: adenylate kinase [Acidobacteriota bacterium]|nr:adenylate kinase [Acidobacteriota bacterium]
MIPEEGQESDNETATGTADFMSGNKKVIILLGPPGAGKGTQAKKLSKEFDLIHISTGDILRKEVREGTELGDKVREIMNAGELVPDELVGEIVRTCLQKHSTAPGFILDGYPRNVNQAEFLMSIADGWPVYAVGIEVEEDVLIKRLAGRRYCPRCGKIYNVYFSPPSTEGICDVCGSELVQRRDDRQEVISERLRVYHEQTRPVIEFFSSQGRYIEIDGSRSVVQVAQALSELVGVIER